MIARGQDPLEYESAAHRIEKAKLVRDSTTGKSLESSFSKHLLHPKVGVFCVYHICVVVVGRLVSGNLNDKMRQFGFHLEIIIFGSQFCQIGENIHISSYLNIT